MGFSPTIKQQAMNSSVRHCCVCHRYKGVKMEVHHLIQEADGGPNTFSNAIPLCFDCHSDAGHFNVRHPKGIKFSIPELTKARDNWYDFVKSNPQVEKINISSQIQTSYYVLHSFEVLESVIKKDFSSIYKFRSRIYLSDNSISNQWRELLEAHLKDYNNNIEQSIIIQVRQFNSIDEYFSTYGSVELIDKTSAEYPYYEAKRTPDWTELLSSVQPNSFLEQLSKSGISAKRFCISLLHKNGDSCGGETPSNGYTEYLEIAPMSFIFLGITNASKEQLKLNTLLTSEKKKFTLPNFHLLPNEIVLIPVATAINIKSIDNESICLDHLDGDRGQDFSRVLNNSDFKEKDVVFLKNKIIPSSIIYNDNQGEYEIDIHKLDFSNLYSINSYWQCGSCPHLFFIDKTGKQKYFREILISSSRKKGSDSFAIPKDVFKISIRELEDEITYIDKIYICLLYTSPSPRD
mgnify:CR=1 FL=1